jgi:hypothetical protein
MRRTLLALFALSLFFGSDDTRAQGAKPVTVSGCTYVGLEGCHYILTTAGQTYQLAPELLIPMPPPYFIVTVTGVIKPKELGFCTAKKILLASAIVLTDKSCRAGPRRAR